MVPTKGVPLQYAAKLLFQFRVEKDGVSNQRRLCEERIVLFDAATVLEALAQAKRKGKVAQHKYNNQKGAVVHFEFVGVMDLLHLGVECEEGEVWYELKNILRPKERAKEILPSEDKLNAMYWAEPLTSRSTGTRKKPRAR
jgi:hypothetical protein